MKRICAYCFHLASEHFLPEGNHEVRKWCTRKYKDNHSCDCGLFVEPGHDPIEEAVLKERRRCMAIVDARTPSHFTRDYRPTDQMRDDILRDIRSGAEFGDT